VLTAFLFPLEDATMTTTTADKEHARAVGQTIFQQLRYDGPFGTLGRIAGREYMTLNSDDKSQGGLVFRASIRKPKTRHWFNITLTWRDTYRVQLLRLRRGQNEIETIVDTDENNLDVYCDELKDLVEQLAEAHV